MRLDPYRAKLYRILFASAAFYNICFGLWASFRPLSFFERLEMAPPNYPAIWACLGMVVGVYGLAYGYAAWRLDRAGPFIAIGLVGKLLGPIGWAATVHSGEWPLRTFTLVLFNDLIWWIPFSLFLLEGTRTGARIRASAPYACALLNFVACLALLFGLRPGTELVSHVGHRVAFIAGHPVLWRAGWAIWIAGGISLVGFYAWWGARVPSQRLGIAGVLVALIGLLVDVFADSLLIGWLPTHYDEIAPAVTFLSGAVGNGLYTIGGAILTLGSTSLWRGSRGPLAARAASGGMQIWAWATWSAGFLLTLASLWGSPAQIALAAGSLFVLFCPFAAAIGWSLR